MALFLGPHWWAGARRNLLLDFYGAREDIRGRHTDNQAGRHSIRTNQRPTSIIPHFLHRMPFLSQPSHFILAWDKHQRCWLACPMVWFHYSNNQCKTTNNVQMTFIYIITSILCHIMSTVCWVSKEIMKHDISFCQTISFLWPNKRHYGSWYHNMTILRWISRRMYKMDLLSFERWFSKTQRFNCKHETSQLL